MEFTASGNQLKLEGRVLCSLMPDWLAGVWKNDLAQLSGKLKLMPIPAWQPGGRRTSIWGGTMLGIPKSSPDIEQAWRFAKHLYLSRDLAETLYRETNIVTPIKAFWTESWYDRPDPFFAGQAPGRLFIQLAPNVPLRTNSPFNREAQTRIRDVLMALREYAESRGVFDPDELVGEARRLVGEVEERLQIQMERNVFLREASS
jgi:arabinosaccharide transport system substrate-binding protein